MFISAEFVAKAAQKTWITVQRIHLVLISLDTATGDQQHSDVVTSSDLMAVSVNVP